MLPYIVPAVMIAVLLLAVEVGHRVGVRRMTRFPDEQRFETGSVQGAMLGILGLLLGFSFAGAAERFIQRQDLVNAESNVIGTAYRRAELLETADALELRAALASYVEHRVRISGAVRFELTEEDVDSIGADHDRIWAAARDGVANKPAAMNTVIPVVNEVLDLHDYRVAAGRKHLPELVLILLGICSVLTLGVMGYASALGRHRNRLMISVIAILIAATLWTTIDLDWSRIGLIRISDRALVELHAALSENPPP